MLTPWLDLKIGFNFQCGFVFVSPMTRIGLATPSLVRYASMRLPSPMALGSPSIHPFVMELLGHFGIALGQLMPNSWRIVVNCMEIWLAANEDKIKVGELVYLYHLKELKEYGYYKLIP